MLEKFGRICNWYGVILFTDLKHFDNTAGDLDVFKLSPNYPASKDLDFSARYFANICFTEDQLFINLKYGFLNSVTSKVSFSSIVAALVPTFILSHPTVSINLMHIGSRMRVIKNNGRFKCVFNSFAVTEKDNEYIITGSKTLYQGNLSFLKNIKQVFFSYCYRKVLTS